MGDDKRVQVLVVGAGLSGATAALFLAKQGIEVLGISKHAGTAPHPKATGQTNRTMELLRIGGVTDDVLAGATGAAGGLVIKVAESLRGQVFQTIVPEDGEFDFSALSPAPFSMASQDHVEPVLVAHARKHGAEILFDTELVSFEQDADGVTARLLDRPTGRLSTVRADYLVAADGPRSRIREQLGIRRHGRGSLAHHVGVVFEADLRDHIAADKGTLYFLQNKAFTGAFIVTNTARRKVLTIEYHPERGESLADYTPERCTELLRIATDVPDLRPDILAITSWEMAALVAERFADGRVFLVGDAAKVTPPTGAQGGNTAIQDGFDIAWKLGAVLRGEAGPGLLDSYESERKPYAQHVVDGSYRNYVERLAPQLLDENTPEPVDPLGLTFSFRFRSWAVIAEDDDPAAWENPYEPSGRPGIRAPHVLVERDGVEVSTVDLFGDGWVLVTLDRAWTDAAAEVRVPELADPSGRLARVYGIGEHGASLVRPDGVVAWRSPELVADPAAVLAEVLDRVLARR
jgi:aklavinone 12-hydroxylase